MAQALNVLVAGPGHFLRQLVKDVEIVREPGYSKLIGFTRASCEYRNYRKVVGGASVNNLCCAAAQISCIEDVIKSAAQMYRVSHLVRPVLN